MWTCDEIATVKLKDNSKKVCFRKQLQETIRFKNERKELEGRSVALCIMKCFENKKFQAFMKLSLNANQFQGKLNALKYMSHILKSRIQKNRIFGFKKIKQKMIQFALAKNLARSLHFLCLRKEKIFKSLVINTLKHQKITNQKAKTKTEKFNKNTVFECDSEQNTSYYSDKLKQFFKIADKQPLLKIKGITLRNLLIEEIKHSQKIKNNNKNHEIFLNVFKNYVESTMQLSIVDNSSSYQYDKNNQVKSCRSIDRFNGKRFVISKEKQLLRQKQMICRSLQNMDFTQVQVQLKNFVKKYKDCKQLPRQDEKIYIILSEFIHQNQKVYKAIEDVNVLLENMTKISIESSKSINTSSSRLVSRQLQKLIKKYQKQLQCEGYADDFLKITKYLKRVLENLQSTFTNSNDCSFQSETKYLQYDKKFNTSSSSRNILPPRPNLQKHHSQDKGNTEQITIKKLMNQKTALAQQLKQSTRILQQLNNEKQKIQLQLQQYSNERQEFQNTIQTLRQEMSQLNTAKDDFLKQISKLEIDCQNMERQRVELDEDLKIEKKTIIDLENINQYLNQENKKLVTIVEKKDRELQRFSRRFEDVDCSNIKLLEDVDCSNIKLNQLAQKDNQSANDHNNQLQKSQGAQVRDDMKFKEFQLVIKNLKEQKIALKQQLQQQKQAFKLLLEKSQMVDTKDQIFQQDCQKENQYILTELQNQQNQKARQELKKTQAKILEINQNLKINNQALKNQIDKFHLKSQLLQKQKQDLQDKIKQLEEDVELLKQVVESPCQKCKNLKFLQEENEKLNSILSIKENLIIDLQADVSNLKDTLNMIQLNSVVNNFDKSSLEKLDQKDICHTNVLETLRIDILILTQENSRLKEQLQLEKDRVLLLNQKLTISQQQLFKAIENQTKTKSLLQQLQISHKKQIIIIQQQNQRLLQDEIFKVVKKQEQEVNQFIRITDKQRQIYYQTIAIPQIRKQWQEQLSSYIGSIVAKEKLQWQQQIANKHQISKIISNN